MISTSPRVLVVRVASMVLDGMYRCDADAGRQLTLAAAMRLCRDL